VLAVNSRIVELQGVGVRFGTVDVLKNVSLDICRGEIVGVTGANGSGKTTLLRVLATLIRPHSGQGQILGKPIGSGETAAVRGRIGLLGHTAALYPELTLAENLRFASRMTGVDEARADLVLAAVGLQGASDRRLDQCSNGMQRRADIARLLVSMPELLLLDEPHAGLDRAAADLVEAAAREVAGRNGAVVIVSHDTHLMQPLVDRMWRIDEGELHQTNGVMDESDKRTPQKGAT